MLAYNIFSFNFAIMYVHFKKRPDFVFPIDVAAITEKLLPIPHPAVFQSSTGRHGKISEWPRPMTISPRVRPQRNHIMLIIRFCRPGRVDLVEAMSTICSTVDRPVKCVFFNAHPSRFVKMIGETSGNIKSVSFW
jgi:hypothetical protein